MISHLAVRNYVLIDTLDIRLEKGFTTITGETGAGKSIILGALGLILGDRADTSTLRDKEKKCIVEGCFFVDGYGLEPFFRDHDLDYDRECFIRREILPSGKSRAFINDTPVVLKVLKSLGKALINIHSQHDKLHLGQGDFQRAVLDDFAQNQTLLDEYSRAYSQYLYHQERLIRLTEENRAARKEQDYYQFLYDELKDADLQPGEKESLEEDQRSITHAEEIREAAYGAFQGLSGDDNNILSRMKSHEGQISRAGKYNEALERLAQRMDEAAIELEDLAAELEQLSQKVEYDPEKLEHINQRLNLLYSLEQKHGVKGTRELKQVKSSLENKLGKIISLEDEIEKERQAVDEAKGKAHNLAKALQQSRKKAAPGISKAFVSVVRKLNMPNASMEVQLNSKETLNHRGYDQVNILFSANKGQIAGPLSQIASGGELSRILLAIKSVLSGKNVLPTIVFDEIDAGISGSAATKVAEIMEEMSRNMQVIAITHLPQIAARGNEHLCVYKYDRHNQTHTDIKTLDEKERISEIAHMISGEDPGENVLITAKNLLKIPIS